MTPQVYKIIEQIMTQCDSATEMLDHYNADGDIPKFADGYYRGKLAGLFNILADICWENLTPLNVKCPLRFFWTQFMSSTGLEKELEIFQIFKQKFSDNQKITENEIMEN